ncbi:pantoate--beta-alanine ligase [Leptothrix cholodnii SP-6]|uniref:Pantothenate synthetase n=1 Tax=Leptothrix cholodnii (strain ATCC 51168 / LMG 8142 / SP-6) TaxID=395495 RepID=PANC_LEPCP|nr:pantoate--beta-alanine ligase [Leptothrix cholodnii]B1Y4K7.1 RecName: Full=Pantothenate synthetase; Short=PS; AltName: Full=Pantoate--beta-alanine ligase; AltName: Full=Pantoate-activating enzyme [Leptothrix cholodnii SP-6]ACB33446.1 pantoate--beta-alanine ligase [Leptothrix cholodnii SP-6]
MQIVHTLADLRAALAPVRRSAGTIAFVPTMGNLHEGHLALVRQARERVGAAGTVVASIFVNRLQFAPHEDFDRYPRTLARDAELLAPAGCDLVFAPAEAELYPQPQTFKVQPDPALAELLEGHFRPGFFTGVCTVVMKLFSIVQPQVAVFGKKDYQQLMVLRRMVEQFALPIEVLGGETLRAHDGLALSSRNGYLGAAEREQALQLSAALRDLLGAVRAGGAPLETLEAQACTALRAQGWLPDYLCVRRRTDLLPPGADEIAAGLPLVALGAARLGNTRLIDNLEG